MSKEICRQKIEDLLSLADIQIGGTRSWDISVHYEEFYSRVMTKGSLALGQSYMEGWWDCPKLDEFFYRVLTANLDDKIKPFKCYLAALKSKILNPQKKSRAFKIGDFHYNLGNDLYEMMLDKRMIYSCGYWDNASSLDEAQEAKLHLICQKLYLKPGMKVLDIGCGWGGTAHFIAEHYQAEVVGVTVSEQQAVLAKKTCKGLPVDIRLEDYRDIKDTFDRIVSIGMFEHVGPKNYATFMRTVRNCLKDDGIFVLHTIGRNKTVNSTDPWVERYIFPDGMLPSPKQICSSIEDLFVLEDWHNFGPDYDKTLMHWFYNFQKNWPSLKQKYGDIFYRMWKYYLLSFAGAFRARHNQLWQIVFSPKGLEGGFKIVRYTQPLP